MTKAITGSPKSLQKLTTPQLLKASLFVTWGASLLLLVATISAIQGQRYAIKTVGKDSAPSILDAQRIKDSLADLDANAANELLVKPGENPEATKSFETRREKLANLLISVAQNITYGDAEKKPIKKLQLGLGEYLQKIQRARDFNELGNKKEVLITYRSAAELIDKTLLPAADELERVNLRELERTYVAEKFASGGSLFLLFISGFLVIGILLALQIFLYRRMRRVINPMLLGATAIAFIFVTHTMASLLSASANLKIAKEDAFASLLALRESRATAYIANADESRYLLDPELAAKHQQAFYREADKIAKLPNGYTFDSLVTALKQNPNINGFTGLFADELNNITFPGEREAAIATVAAFGNYFKIDKQIRQLAQAGKFQEAIALCTGNNQGESNWAFEEFKKAHDQVLNMNNTAFEQAIDKGFKNLQGFEVSTPAVVAAIALLTLFGLLPRIKEYSA